MGIHSAQASATTEPNCACCGSGSGTGIVCEGTPIPQCFILTAEFTPGGTISGKICFQGIYSGPVPFRTGVICNAPGCFGAYAEFDSYAMWYGRFGDTEIYFFGKYLPGVPDTVTIVCNVNDPKRCDNEAGGGNCALLYQVNVLHICSPVFLVDDTLGEGLGQDCFGFPAGTGGHVHITIVPAP